MTEEYSPKVLVVDDSITNVVLIEAVLGELNYDVTTTLNVKEAFYAVKKSNPDIILTDLLMPRISGYDFVKELKLNDDTKEIPIIVISATTAQLSITKLFKMGVNCFVKKPLDIYELIYSVQYYLPKSKLGTSYNFLLKEFAEIFIRNGELEKDLNNRIRKIEKLKYLLNILKNNPRITERRRDFLGELYFELLNKESQIKNYNIILKTMDNINFIDYLEEVLINPDTELWIVKSILEHFSKKNIFIHEWMLKKN